MKKEDSGNEAFGRYVLMTVVIAEIIGVLVGSTLEVKGLLGITVLASLILFISLTPSGGGLGGGLFIALTVLGASVFILSTWLAQLLKLFVLH